MTNLNFENKSVRRIEFFQIEDYHQSAGANTSFKYFVLPVMAKYNFGKKKNIFINGGPFLGYLLKSTSKSSGFPDSDFSDLYKKIDLGLSFGIGTKIIFNEKNNINIEVRENMGLTNISDAPEYYYGNIKTNSLSLILNWDFGI